jgi:autotransporter-associated beta strand protein
LAIENNSAFGTSGLTFNGGTIIASGGARTISNNAIISVNNGTIGGTDALTINGTLTNSGANRTLTVSSTATTTFGGVFLSETIGTGRTLTITGAGNIVINGVIANFNGAGTAGSLTFNASYSGTATINGTNTYSGTTTLSAGSFVLGNKAAFGTSSVAINGVSVSANTDLSGANAIANIVTTLGGDNTFTGTNNIEFTGSVTQTASRTITNNMSGGILKFSGPLNLSSNASNNTLTINGSGNTTISGVIANGGTSTASI